MAENNSIADILAELDRAHDDLRAARERLAELLPIGATQPDAAGGRKDVHFVSGMQADSEQDESLRRVSAEAWEHAQRALVAAQEKVHLANREIRRLLQAEQ